jgi:hypothetical protein
LADRSTRVPLGILEDVLVKVGDFIYLANFIVLDTHQTSLNPLEISVILGRPFLATLDATIYCKDGRMSIAWGKEEKVINIFKYKWELEITCRKNAPLTLWTYFLKKTMRLMWTI